MESRKKWGAGTLLLLTGVAINIQIRTAAAASLYSPRRTPSKFAESCEKVCITENCFVKAQHFLDIMNTEVDPCDDFYQFVCGGFIRQKNIIDEAVVVNPFSLAQMTLSNEIYTDIAAPIRYTDLEAFKKTKNYYRSCMDRFRVEKEGVRPVMEILDKIGGWPVLMGDQWNESSYDWRDTVYRIREEEFFIFFPIVATIEIDFKNSSKYMIKVQNAVTTISPMFMLDDPDKKLLKAYFDYMMNVTVSLGADNETAHRDMKAVLDFEIELFNIKTPAEEMVNVTEVDNQMSIRDLSRKYPSIPWLNLLNKMFNPSGVFVNDTETIFVADLDYIPKLEYLLKATPKRVVANYLAFYLTHVTLMYMPERLRQAVLDFNNVVEGTKQSMNRESWCLNEIMEAFPISVSAMYVRKYFNKDMKDSVLELVKNIKDQSKKRLKEVDWMDDETRKAALEKLESMGISVGFADELMDDRKVDDYYKELVITRGNYLKAAFNVSSFLVKQNYKVLRKPVDKNLWTLSHNAAVINAYYIPQKNIIEIPAGFLHSFFKPDMPNYLNYGSIGSIIGHEITHGFDNQGRKHDKRGNQNNWWQTSTEEHFYRKARCIIDQYNNFTVKEVGLNVNGARTQGENIADNAGFKMAYYAYNEWSKNVTEPCLPYLYYSQKQLFWMSAASNWCTKERPAYLRDILSTDPHSPESARVTLSFSNIKEFSDDFGCRLGSRMNPENKCVIW
ncbi:neprilysin-2-like [Copidosoma floridanum]|uniref:neprilysin-2-like n=1 Tax=Copidosoma floridanum TaxID=29053 RepID=UPI0006C95310|nr:neprilysin-2-like [Copidosoma floridanum]